MKKVVVVGGGFSGLVQAYFLSREGFEVDLHEAGPRVGGLIHTTKTEDGLAESAANGFILNETLEELCQDLGISYIRPLKGARRRYIFRGGLRRWPLSLFETLVLLVKALPLFFFRKKTFAPQSDETIWRWGLRVLGLGATQYLVAPALQGIYAGNARRMSASLILGPMLNASSAAATGPKKKPRFRGTVSFAGGMGDIIQALEKKLRAQGVKIHLNSNYKLTDLQTPHVVCVSASHAPGVVAEVSPATAQTLSKIEILPVLSITVFWRHAENKIEGFGCLFPEDQGTPVLGILSPTYIFENRGPLYSETWIFGGAHSPQILDRTDQEILDLIQNERTKLLGGSAELKEYRLHRWPQALPHYTLEHQYLLRQLDLPKGLYLNGNYLGVIGLSKILVQAKDLAAKIRRDF